MRVWQHGPRWRPVSIYLNRQSLYPWAWLLARIITMRKFFILISLSFALLFASSGISVAAGPINKQQAATIAKSQFQGRVIAVDEVKQDNKPVYQVKVLDKKGGLHTVIIDNQTGDVISAH